MQFSNIFVTFLLSTAVAAKGNNKAETNGTKAVTDKSLCNEMSKLQKLVSVASNTTKLADKTDNNATKIAEIQAKASDASTQLATMSSNATLMSTCAVIDAAQDTEKTCAKMASLQKSIDLAANTTKLDAKAKGNATKVAQLQAKASAATTKLATMTSNTTLTDACSSIAATKKAEKEAKKANGTSDAATASSTSTSGAGILDAKTGGVLSLVVMVAAGVAML